MTMSKIYPNKPFLLLMYGYPGSGKTYFARQFTESVQAGHIQPDRVRGELFEQPRHDTQENDVVGQLTNYLIEEFLAAGLSVVLDLNAARAKQRRYYRELAKRNRAIPVLIWFQLDQETAFYRNAKRDRRRADDKYAAQWDRTSFESVISQMQNPVHGEDYAVVSGKHLFNMQQSAVISRLRSKGVLAHEDTQSRVIKPGLVNLIPKAGDRHPGPRRNISIR